MLPCGLVLSGTRADIHLRFTLSWRQRRTSGLEEVFPCSARTASDMCSPTISGEGVPACSADSNNLTLRRRPLSAQWPHRTKLDGTGLPGPCWHQRNSWRGCDWCAGGANHSEHSQRPATVTDARDGGNEALRLSRIKGDGRRSLAVGDGERRIGCPDDELCIRLLGVAWGGLR